MPEILDIQREFRGLPPPTPLDNFMFASCFQGLESARRAMSLVNAVLPAGP